MEGINKVFTSELQTYVSELKEVMHQRGIVIVKYKPMIKHGNQYCLTLQFSPIENSQKIFVNNSFRMYVPKP